MVIKSDAKEIDKTLFCFVTHFVFTVGLRLEFRDPHLFKAPFSSLFLTKLLISVNHTPRDTSQIPQISQILPITTLI